PASYFLNNAGGSDAFVSKLDASGNFLWARQLGGPGDEVGRSLAVDASGNVYICGYFNGTADFDPGPGTFNLVTTSGQAAFICKLDAAGNFVYAKQITGSGLNGAISDALSLAPDGGGNILVSGIFSATADFDPGAGVYNITAFGAGDAYVLKLDAAGNFVWAIQLGGVDNDYAYGVAADAAGNVYASGISFGTGDYDPGAGVYELGNAGGIDAYVCKLSPSGNFIWAKQIAGAGTDYIYSLAVDGSGNVYTTGFFTGTTYFDPVSGAHSLTSAAGSRDAYVCKFDPAGNVVWAKQFGGTGDDNSYAVAVDAAGNVYTTGTYLGTVDFDPGSGTFTLGTTGGNQNAFISKLDGSGNFIWAKQLGGLYSVLASAVGVDAGGSVYAAGSFQGTIDFDPGATVYNLTATGSHDIFLVKLASTALPVQLLNFSAIVHDKNMVDISWATATEINNNYFTVERSADARSFEQVAVIKGATNSSLPLSYMTTDKTPLPGKSYYRLRQTDLDGKFTNSAIVQVEVPASSGAFTIYPNPVHNLLQIQLPGFANTKIVWQVQDETGRVLLQQSGEANTLRQTIDVSALPNGMYHLVLKTGDHTTVKKFIRQ
ncbi:MAG: SBBP repeat-containing protein, partial [Bacteroidota bacterium]